LDNQFPEKFMETNLISGARFFVLILALFFLAPNSIRAAAGDLDTRFGNGGVVQTDFTGGDDYGFGVKVQSDGKTVVVGQSGVYPLFHTALTRYNKSGALDRSFGNNGRVVAALDSGGDGSTALAFQSDGKIVTAGSVIHNNFLLAFITARFNPDGTLDQTFGTNGVVQTTFGDAAAEGNDVVLQPDGKIVVVGFSGAGSYSSNNNVALVRYNPDGTLDQTFGTGGKVKNISGVGTSVALQADGKIVVVGTFDPGSTSSRFLLARYNSDGTLDGTFGSSGVTTTAIGNGDAFSFAIGLLSGGRIVLGGYSSGTQDHDFTVACYTSNGLLDQTFGNGGIAATDFGGTDDIAYGLAVQRDQVVLGGRSGFYPNFNFGLARYTSSGQPDQTFGAGGKVVTPVANSSNGYAVALAGGKIILAGAVADSQRPFDFGVARYLGR
jgi:uncharacterized delta-60 repeat protein